MEDQLDTLNTLIPECLERHAPLRKVKFTRPHAPWMKDVAIVDLQQKRDKARYKAHKTQVPNDWEAFRNTQNQLNKKKLL